MLFLDEVHRFNKAQQDTFLPFLEDGTLIFIGATTENPSLRGRQRAAVARAGLCAAALRWPMIWRRCCARRCATGARARRRGDRAREPEALDLIARAADGDARRALNMLELAAGLAGCAAVRELIRSPLPQEVASGGRRRFDKGGDQFYDQISALHKAVRGTDPDGALYWLAGCSMAAATRSTSPDGWCAWPLRTSGLADPRRLALDAGCLGGL